MAEDNKIDINELEKLLDENDKSSSKFNFAAIYSMLVLNWQYFLFSIIICVAGAFIYLRYTEPTYKLSARLLIKNEESSIGKSTMDMMSSMMDMGLMSNSSGIENEVEVIKSRTLIRDVVKDMNLYSEYRRKGRVRDVIVYGNQPIFVEMDPFHLDSLDREYIEEGLISSISMKISSKDGKYLVEGTVFRGGKNRDKTPEDFSAELDALPTHIETSLGTLTLTGSSRYTINDGEVYLVQILPPIVVATNFLAHMTVEQTSKKTDIALVTLVDKNTQRGIDFLRHLAVCYNRQANADKNEIAFRTEEFINDRIGKINAELGSTEDRLENFKRQQSVTGLSFDVTQAVQMSNQYSSRLAEVNSQIQMIDYLREYVNNPNNKYQIIPSNVGLNDGVSTQLIESYNKAVLDRSRLLASASEMSPQVQTLTETIQKLSSSIDAALLQARRSADIVRQGLSDEFGKYHGQVSSAPIQERVLTQIGRQLEVKSGVYLLLLQKREENSIALAATADKGKLIDEPLNEGKVNPKNLIVILLAIFLALGIPFAIILLLKLFRYKIEGRNDVEELTKLPIIADVAMASDDVKSAAGIVVHENENTQMDEIFRSLRSNVLFMLKENQKTILFTSGISGEGKTFCAANLATSFALLGKKVVLCGMDIRKPALGRLFSINDRKKGITMLLKKDSVTMQDIDEQITASGTNDNLDLLLAGPIPPNPTELLARDSFNQIMELLREKYDYVILDTAPVGLVTDTLQIAVHANVCIYVCRADYTPKSSFGLLNSLCDEGKLPNACLLLNGIDMSRRKYGYYYGYGVYGKYGRYGYGRYGNYGNYGSYGQYGLYSDSHYGQKDDHSIKR